MVLLSSDQQALVDAIDAQRRQVAHMEREWTPHTAEGRAQGLEHWQSYAADLSSSRLGLETDEEFLRRGQRRQWRKDEQETLQEARELRIAVLRSMISFREEEKVRGCY